MASCQQNPISDQTKTFVMRIKIHGKLSAESFTVLLPLGEHSWGTVKWPLDGGLP